MEAEPKTGVALASCRRKMTSVGGLVRGKFALMDDPAASAPHTNMLDYDALQPLSMRQMPKSTSHSRWLQLTDNAGTVLLFAAVETFGQNRIGQEDIDLDGAVPLEI